MGTWSFLTTSGVWRKASKDGDCLDNGRDCCVQISGTALPSCAGGAGFLNVRGDEGGDGRAIERGKSGC